MRIFTSMNAFNIILSIARTTHNRGNPHLLMMNYINSKSIRQDVKTIAYTSRSSLSLTHMPNMVNQLNLITSIVNELLVIEDGVRGIAKENVRFLESVHKAWHSDNRLIRRDCEPLFINIALLFEFEMDSVRVLLYSFCRADISWISNIWEALFDRVESDAHFP